MPYLYPGPASIVVGMWYFAPGDLPVLLLMAGRTPDPNFMLAASPMVPVWPLPPLTLHRVVTG